MKTIPSILFIIKEVATYTVDRQIGNTSATATLDIAYENKLVHLVAFFPVSQQNLNFFYDLITIEGFRSKHVHVQAREESIDSTDLEMLCCPI